MLISVEDYRKQARRLPRFVFKDVDGAAEDERCLDCNRAALDAITLVPQVLRDTTTVATGIEVFGRQWAQPFGAAPTGFNGLLRPKGDLLIARAAASAGVPFMLSTASNTRLEEVAGAGGMQWLQLYVMGARSIAEQLVRRARTNKFEALVLTVDVPVSGYRERDVRNGFRLPFKPTPKTLLDLCLHPGWVLRQGAAGTPQFANLTESENEITSPQLQAALLASTMDRSLAWESLAWLRQLWDGPLLVKGLLHYEDALRAVNAGADGIIVSCHGGRQLDAAPATMTVLPRFVDMINGRIPVFVDSGFRRVSDVAKALACGATAAFIGRPLLYGLGADGERGVSAVFKLFVQKLLRTLILFGARSPKELGPDNLLDAVRASQRLQAAPADGGRSRALPLFGAAGASTPARIKIHVWR